MPYTFSHPGYASLLKRISPIPLSTTGLVFGSIAPDMDIIFRLSHQRSHLFNYDLFCVFAYIFPMALLFGIYFHLVMRNTIIDHLPEPFAARYRHYKDFNYLAYLPKRLPSVILSLFISIYLHIFLDLISHFNATTFETFGGIMYQSWIASQLFFYGSIYLPPLLLSFWGFYLILKFSHCRLKDFITGFNQIRSEQRIRPFYIWLTGLTLASSVIKTLYTGIESGFAVDTIAINLTQGMLIGITVTPALYLLRNKIKG